MPRSPDGAYPHVVAVNVDDDMLAAIDAIADARDRSRSWIGREAFAFFLDNLDGDNQPATDATDTTAA